MILSAARDQRRFQFERDTFAFHNELVWEYRFDPATCRPTTCRNEPPPTYAHRCFVMVRSARQFFYHARFDFIETEAAIRFVAYDPNIQEHPAELTYDRARRTFFLLPNHYWAGGRVDVVEVYRGWFY